jgi:integrase
LPADGESDNYAYSTAEVQGICAAAGPFFGDVFRFLALSGQLKKAKEAAGANRGTLHSFRHFFVSTMANANASPFKVMKIVGHSSLDIILTYYHVSEDELLGAVDGVNFGAVLGGASEEEKKTEK